MPGIDSYTKLMLHCDGDDASTTFTDSSSNNYTVTAGGNAQIDTDQSKFGGASALFDSSGDYLSVPDSSDWDFGTDDFTIDFWCRPKDVSKECVFVDRQGTSAGYSNLYIASYIGGLVNFACYSGTSKQVQIYETGTQYFFNNTWAHYAIIRYGSTFWACVDGVKVGEQTGKTFSWPNVSTTMNFGKCHWTTNSCNSNIDEIRISRGIARWTSFPFTPPTSAYSADSTRFMTTNKGWL